MDVGNIAVFCLLTLVLGGFIHTGLLAVRVAFDNDLRKIPGPFIARFTSLPLKLKILSGQRTAHIHALHEKYGSIVRIAPQEISVVDMNSVRQIHKIGSPFRKAMWYKELTQQFDDDNCTVFAIQDPQKASIRRKLFQRAATRAAVQQWEPVIAKIADQAVQKIKRDAERGVVDIMKWWSMMTADVLSCLAFGETYDIIEAEEKPPHIKDIEGALVLGGLRYELPWLWPIIRCIPFPNIGFPQSLFLRLRKYGSVAIRNTRKTSSSNVKTLFCEMLPTGAGEQPLTDSVIALESTNIIIAGSETTAVALTYLTYAVLKDISIKTRLVDELSSCSDNPGWEELEELPFLNGVIQETLRLYSPIPATLKREAPPEGAILGPYKIPSGVVVGTQAYTIHRDPVVWQDAERFDPDRWVNPTPDMKAAFMPFGGAARMCLGQNVARLELLHAASRFFRTCPNAIISKVMKDKDMEILDFFAARPAGGKCDITMNETRSGRVLA